MKDIFEPKMMTEERAPAGSQHFQVLLVEDTPGDARLVTALLAEVDANPIQLIHVSRLSDAMETLQAVQIDAMFLDLSLTDVSGVGVTASQTGLSSYPNRGIDGRATGIPDVRSQGTWGGGIFTEGGD